LSLIALSCNTLAQTPHHVAPPIIKGSEHPEQISDQQAWLMQLIASTSLDTDQELTKKHAQLHRRNWMGEGSDQPLGEFREKYDRLLNDYNSTISNPEMATIDLRMQLSKYLDQLVDDTIANLRLRVSPEAWPDINAQVQTAKSQMSVQQSAAAQPGSVGARCYL
jgi:hypothetical protein